MKAFGYIESPYDDRDIIFSNILPVSNKYILKNISAVKDQGLKPICAAISLATMINWQIFVKRDTTVKPLKEYNGSSWIVRPLKEYNGSSWVTRQNKTF